MSKQIDELIIQFQSLKINMIWVIQCSIRLLTFNCELSFKNLFIQIFSKFQIYELLIKIYNLELQLLGI